MTQDTRPVVVGVDGTERTGAALAHAALEARSRRTTLRLLHVAPGYQPTTPMLPLAPDDLQDVGRRILRRARDEVAVIAADLEVTTELTTGSRSRGIVDGATGAQLVVIGRADRRGLLALWAGNTAAAVCAHASCPVLVVPESWSAGPAERHRIVLGVPADGADDGQLVSVFSRAAEHGATVVGVHAWQVPDPYADIVEARTHEADWISEGDALVADLFAHARTGFPDVPVEVQVVHGKPAQVLHDASRDADLLVLLRRHHPFVPRGHLGGTARALVRTSTIPLLVLPAPERPWLSDLVLEEAGEIRPA